MRKAKSGAAASMLSMIGSSGQDGKPSAQTARQMSFENTISTTTASSCLASVQHSLFLSVIAPEIAASQEAICMECVCVHTQTQTCSRSHVIARQVPPSAMQLGKCSRPSQSLPRRSAYLRGVGAGACTQDFTYGLALKLFRSP